MSSSVTQEELTYLAPGEAPVQPAGAGEAMVIEPVTGEVRVLSVEQARVLSAVRGEHTLAEHAALAARRLGTRPDTTRALVEALAMRGLLLERQALMARLHAAARTGRERATIGALGVPARGRTEAVVACVRGHLEAARAHGRRVTAVVADSAEGSAAEATRAALGALGAEWEIRVAGRAERARFAALLAAAAEVDPEVVTLALLGDARIGIDTGANRNTLLLDGAGQALLMADDDVRPRFARPPFAAGADGGSDPLGGAGLVWMSGDPFAAGFADPGEEVVSEEGWIMLDPFAVHEALLGADVARTALAPGARGSRSRGTGEMRAPLAGTGNGSTTGLRGAGASSPDLAGDGDDGADVRGAGGGFLRRLVRHGGRVAITQVGCAGDHGMGTSTSLLLVRGATRERLVASEARLRDALARRQIVRSPERAVISDTDFCMSTHLGVDHRELVPPFPFAGRNTDGAFGGLLRACAEDAFAGFLPWAIAHRDAGSGEAARTGSIEEEIDAAGRSGVNEVLRVAIGALADPRGAGTAAHLVTLGAALERLARRPRDADRFLREQVVRALGQMLGRIEQALDQHRRAPQAWAALVERLAGAVRRALVDPTVHLPAELVGDHGVEGARALLLEHTANVGRLLAAWPAMVGAARELRARDERPSVRLHRA